MRNKLEEIIEFGLITSFVVYRKEGSTYFLGKPEQMAIRIVDDLVEIEDLDNKWIIPGKLLLTRGHPRVLLIETPFGDVSITNIRGRVSVDPAYTTLPPGNYAEEEY